MNESAQNSNCSLKGSVLKLARSMKARAVQVETGGDSFWDWWLSGCLVQSYFGG